MSNTIILDDHVEIPLTLDSLAAFRAWAVSDEFPEQGRVDYLGGRIEVDMSPEDLHTHGKLKVELFIVLGTRIRRLRLGELYCDRARVSCPEADLSVEPDLVFVSEEALDSGRVKLVPKSSAGPDRYVELEGPPDLIVEIVSDRSKTKDTRRLPPAYFQAGVPEFWLLDARGPELVFQIHRRGPSGYEPVPADAEGYQSSSILRNSYLLVRSRNASGRLEFELREKPAE